MASETTIDPDGATSMPEETFDPGAEGGPAGEGMGEDSMGGDEKGEVFNSTSGDFRWVVGAYHCGARV